MSFIPALLCTILIFMDQQITAVIINRKEHKLKVCHYFTICSFLVNKESCSLAEMSFVVYVCIHRKAVGIIWTCLWWV